DRSYADLVAEARSRIPGLHPAWTDHNPTDPGIVLVELLAWLAEMLIYRADQVPEDHYDAFLSILNGQGWSRTIPLDSAIRAPLLPCGAHYRAAPPADFEHLVLHDWPKTSEALGLGDTGVVRRARSLSQLNLEADGMEQLSPAPGHVSLVIVPSPRDERDETPQPSPALLEALLKWLEPRRPPAAGHHTVGPGYVNVAISARLVLRDNYAPLTTARSGILSNKAIAAETRRQAIAAMQAYFNPLTGGAHSQGWPFGRNVYLSEIYQLLDGLP